MNLDLTADRVREVLSFNPDTGVFVRREGFRGAGQVAGNLNAAGYLRMNIDDKSFRVHRLAWLHFYGVWPNDQIDHINGIRTDNRIANLRDVSGPTNRQNRRKAHVNNRSGFLGVFTITRASGLVVYETRVEYAGKKHYAGIYRTPEEAHAAYVEAKRTLHAGCTI